MLRTVLLVKHAKPEKLEGVDSHQWPLCQEGRDATQSLASKLLSAPPLPAGSKFSRVACSTEPKARETAQILATALSLPLTEIPGLGEHARSTVPLMKTPEFVSAIANFFKRPTQLVLGEETARQALRRFEKAVDEALDQTPDGNVIVVTHGTVLALWLEHYARLDPFLVWRQMGLPSYAAVTWPDCDITHRLDRI